MSTGVQAYGASARPDLRPMRETDLDAVMAVEVRAYPFPWTRGIFRDCLDAGYAMWLQERQGDLVGYGVLSIAADEAHILNLCTAPGNEGQGLGQRMLQSLLKIARGHGAQRVFLEVRPSNTRAITLYERSGFNEIGRRPRYYPAQNGREDAIVMAMELLD
ncbi:MAG: ribosomal protein S18-alanine N-acetyltransferase [Thermomonas sp.]|uniref:ribosomal protein S18-alanine N-acetyltransferase n=1 Tax=Thermomonas sp. TaxID=1971895 RepID=UPI001ECFDDCA|nr:ribosomal protein S18-alanine N-acetyltransferase [Thermomonas sp.]MBV2208697.1 ribosomal protein S18-alanine N-acetyltransferase [Thermomonas sp.]